MKKLEARLNYKRYKLKNFCHEFLTTAKTAPKTKFLKFIYLQLKSKPPSAKDEICSTCNLSNQNFQIFKYKAKQQSSTNTLKVTQIFINN